MSRDVEGGGNRNLRLNESKIVESEELAPGIVLDFNARTRWWTLKSCTKLVCVAGQVAHPLGCCSLNHRKLNS